MPETETRFFEKLMLPDDHDEVGNPMPISSVGLAVALPTMTPGGNLTEVSHAVAIGPADDLADLPARVLPGTRIVETCSHQIASSLVASGQYVEIDPPSKAVIAKHTRDTAAHIDARAKRDKQIEAGHEPAPDAADQPTSEETS